MRRPNRASPRPFTAAQIGKLVCRYLRGVTDVAGDAISSSPFGQLGLRARLREEIDVCLPCADDVADSQEEAAEDAVNEAVVTSLIGTVQANSTLIAIGITVLGAVAVLPRLISFLPRAALLVLPVAARTAAAQVPALVTRLRAQEAANDAIIRTVIQLKRAA